MIRSNNTTSSDRSFPMTMICSSSVIPSMSGRSSLAGRISADSMPKCDLGLAGMVGDHLSFLPDATATPS
jgi:hypothetical protein